MTKGSSHNVKYHPPLPCICYPPKRRQLIPISSILNPHTPIRQLPTTAIPNSLSFVSRQQLKSWGRVQQMRSSCRPVGSKLQRWSQSVLLLQSSWKYSVFPPASPSPPHPPRWRVWSTQGHPSFWWIVARPFLIVNWLLVQCALFVVDESFLFGDEHLWSNSPICYKWLQMY